MQPQIFDTKARMGAEAASQGAALIRDAIENKGAAAIIVATGASQFEVLDALTQEDLDWSKVTGFHLDEYIGISIDHPASFRKYLRERFVDHVPLAGFHYIDGEGDASEECARLDALIQTVEIDVAFVGIGENGHLAFNDPPADFETSKPYLVVQLDATCRQQQHGEGWFDSLNDVPTHAISMSVQQIMNAQHIICTVPDARKADAVRNTLLGAVSPDVPASMLQQHADARLFLDQPAASRL
ncbi:MAG: glucosamine-6-phosphate deaminase [Kiritimatiellia bacterium]|jgi:glucosamine-6-phosphate deaminase